MAFDIGSVVAHIKADVSDFEKGINSVKKQTANLSSSFMSASKTAAVFAGVIGTAAGVGLTAFLKDSSEEANNFSKSMTTLEIISGRFGVKAEDAKKAAKELGSELRIGTGGAAEALQNLLKTGLNLDQSKELLKRFTNEAMTGKAPTLSLGQAVQNLSFAYATNNSAIGNLSGINENFSDITEKGRQALIKEGVAVNTITDDMAKYRGMIDLTNLTLGSSEKFAGTLIDTQTILDQKMTDLKITVGSALNPVLNTFLKHIVAIMPSTEQVNGAIGKMKDVIQGLVTLITERDLTGPFLRALGLNEDDPIVPKIMEVRDALVGFGNWIKDNQEIIIKFLTGMAIAFGALAVIGTITALIAALANPLTLIVIAAGLLYTAWTTNFMGIQDITRRVVYYVEQIFTELKAWWIVYGDSIKMITQGAWNFILGVFTLVGGQIFNTIKLMWQLITGDWKGAWQTIMDMNENARKSFTLMFTGLAQMIAGAFTAMVTAVVQQLESLWNKAKDFAGKIKKELDKINPFHRESPSLVDNVMNGVEIIKNQYKSLSEGVTGMVNPVPGAGNGSQSAVANGGVNITIDMNGAFISDELSAMRLGEKIGDSLIRKLQQNVRF